MKNLTHNNPWLRYVSFLSLILLIAATAFSSRAAAPTVLFQEDFESGIPGWFAVQPSGGAYIDGPMLWEYDGINNSYSEQSNLYTENANTPVNRIACMLVNNTATSDSYTYTARLTGGDNDGWGLIFGYQNETTFYRFQIASQSDAVRNVNWPYTGWSVDRMNDRAITSIAVNSAAFVYAPGIPFDVTISVTNDLGNKKLSITVTNDPLGAATVLPLLIDQPLPSSAAGKVGIFSWGMSGVVSGVKSFRVQNPSLSPVPLSSGPTPLANWSFLVTPRADGTIPALTAGGPTNGFWGQGIGINGQRGVLIENTDWTADNVVTASTNFAAPTAVVGDVNWTNYVYSARFLNSDDDGFGMMLRYKDETNFYRIAFRQQNAQTGIKRGLTVQKNVNRAFAMMYSNSVSGFLPPINGVLPFDVYAYIRTNTLQIIAISNAVGTAPAMAASGPIDMAGGTVAGTQDTGKIGLFSWAMLSLQCDSVKVESISGEGLQVISPYGSPNPAVGLNDIPIGTLVTAKVDNVVNSEPGVRRVLNGWSGAGSVPASGSTNEVSFNLNAFSSIIWRFRTEYQLTVSTTPGGTVGFLGSQFLPEGTNLTIIATNSPGYVFLGWSGSAASQTTNLNFTLSGPITLLARFTADSDGDGLPDEWETYWFGNLAQGAAGDPDGDGNSNLVEFQLGTNPAFAEPAIFADGITSRWINEFRDRAIPGWFVVTNFGGGFRGLWEASNQNEGSTTPGVSGANSVPSVSFQGPTMSIRTNYWNPGWAGTFSLQAEYSVGDDDGSCLYFRYLNESNYYRVTIDGQTQTTISPLKGVTVQMRTNGIFAGITPLTDVDPGAATFNDPLDSSGYKKLRVTVNATNDFFEIHVAGWDRNIVPPDWDTNGEKVITFQDTALSTGRVGVGDWGMSTFGAWNATTDAPPASVFSPIGAGMFIDNIALMVDGTNAFTEDWETANLHTDFPAGWENPYSNGIPNTISGDWHITAHGTVGNLQNTFGSLHTGTATNPKQDAEGPILLVTPGTNGNYILQLGIQPGDDGGMGFVYDYLDTNNFARVMFDSQVPAANGELLQGLNVGRKTAGVWKNILVGDRTFVYTPGRAFEVRFANNNGVYTMVAWNTDAPATTYRWQWTDQSAALTNRFGYAVWNMPDAHFTHLGASALNNLSTTKFQITSISTSGPNLVLGVSKPLYSLYTVLRASSVNGPFIAVAPNQNGLSYSEPLPGAPAFYKLLLQQ